MYTPFVKISVGTQEPKLRIYTLFKAFALSVMVFGALRAQTPERAVDFTSTLYTKPARVVSMLPGTCSLNEIVLLTSASPVGRLWVCTATNTWTQQGVTGVTCDPSQLMALLPDGTCLAVGYGGGGGISSGGSSPGLTWAAASTTWVSESHTWATI